VFVLGGVVVVVWVVRCALFVCVLFSFVAPFTTAVQITRSCCCTLISLHCTFVVTAFPRCRLLLPLRSLQTCSRCDLFRTLLALLPFTILPAFLFIVDGGGADATLLRCWRCRCRLRYGTFVLLFDSFVPGDSC